MSNITSFDPADIATPKLFGHIVGSVSPRPIAFVSTIDKAGNINLSPFSFFNAFSANPPLVIFSCSRRVRDATNKHTIANIREVGEVVVNTVNYPMVEQMSLASTEYDKGVNEFVKAGFTQVASDVVAPPRVGESPVAMECVVEQVIEAGTGGGAGNIVIARVVKMHIQNQYLDENGMLDTQKLDMVGRMGGSWYCRASGDALFEIPKPLRTKGIGVDQLPEHIRNSHELTGNQLGRLANIEQLPTAQEVQAYTQTNEQLQAILKQDNALTAATTLASTLLAQGHTLEALMCLMAAE